MDNFIYFFRSYSLLFLILIAIPTVLMWLGKCRHLLNMNWREVFLALFVFVLFGGIAVKFFSFTEAQWTMNLFGLVFFMPIAFYGWAKYTGRDISKTFDVFVICITIAMEFGKLNCLASGCCRGMVIPNTQGMRVPIRELEIIYYIVFNCYFMKKILKNETYGQVYPLYMISYGFMRFIFEFFRVSNFETRLFHLSHLWAVLAIVIGLSVYYEFAQYRN